MSQLIQILLAVAAVPILGIMLAFSVRRQRMAGTYHPYALRLVSLVWLLATAASVHSACGPIGCSYGVGFGWVAALIPGISSQSVGTLAMVFLVAYLLLCVYFIGHLLGAAIWWVQSSFRRV